MFWYEFQNRNMIRIIIKKSYQNRIMLRFLNFVSKHRKCSKLSVNHYFCCLLLLGGRVGSMTVRLSRGGVFWGCIPALWLNSWVWYDFWYEFSFRKRNFKTQKSMEKIKIWKIGIQGPSGTSSSTGIWKSLFEKCFGVLKFVPENCLIFVEVLEQMIRMRLERRDNFIAWGCGASSVAFMDCSERSWSQKTSKHLQVYQISLSMTLRKFVSDSYQIRIKY